MRLCFKIFAGSITVDNPGIIQVIPPKLNCSFAPPGDLTPLADVAPQLQPMVVSPTKPIIDTKIPKTRIQPGPPRSKIVNAKTFGSDPYW